MTLIIGALALDAMVFCSDTEEGTSGGGKRDVRKLSTYRGDDWEMIVGAAGFGPLCDLIAARIRSVSEASDFIDHAEGKLSEVLKQLYAEYIHEKLSERKQYDRQISLVIGIVNRKSGKRTLYQTTEEIIHPVQHPYACAGVGQEIAYYLMDRLFDSNLEYKQANRMLTFVMREAKESVGNVGGNTQMITIRYGQSGVFSSGFAPGWDAKEPRLWEKFEKFWMI